MSNLPMNTHSGPGAWPAKEAKVAAHVEKAKQEYATLEKRDGVAVVTFNRPEKLNALNAGLADAVLSLLRGVKRDHSVSVLITTGTGDKAYTVGGDLKEYAAKTRKRSKIPELIEEIRTFPKVTIAAINGYCLGAGIALLAAHDLAIASRENASFGLPEIARGIAPGFPAPGIFRAVAPKLAFEMILTGATWDAEKAFQAGLINKIARHGELRECAFLWGREIARWDKSVLKYCKEVGAAIMDCAAYRQALEVTSVIHKLHNLENPGYDLRLKRWVQRNDSTLSESEEA